MPGKKPELPKRFFFEMADLTAQCTEAELAALLNLALAQCAQRGFLDLAFCERMVDMVDGAWRGELSRTGLDCSSVDRQMKEDEKKAGKKKWH